MSKMAFKRSVCLAAIALMIVASGAEANGRLNNLRGRFQNPTNSYSAAEAGTTGRDSWATASAAHGDGLHAEHPSYEHPPPATRPYHSSQPASPPHYAGGYQPSVQQPHYARPAPRRAQAAARAGAGAARAEATSTRVSPPQAYGHPTAYRAPARGHSPHRPQYRYPEEPAYAPEVAQPRPAYQSRYRPTAPGAPQLPRVSANHGGRFRRPSVSSSATAGPHGSTATSSGPGHYGHAQAAHGYNGHASHGAASARASASHRPAGYEAHSLEQEHEHEHYSEPETVDQYAAQAGTYANDGHGLVSSSYVRSTDSEESHEDGKEDSDHYYNAGSYGKTYDENHHESYDNDDEDVVYTPQMYRSKKSKTNYNKDASKTRRETGSSVLAKDRHSASYNKDNKKFKENVDKVFHKEGAGVLETGHSSESSDFDEESEEAKDSRNLGSFVGVDGVRHARRPAFNPTASAAATATSAGVSSNSSAGRK